jgi:hypothetical protein
VPAEAAAARARSSRRKEDEGMKRVQFEAEARRQSRRIARDPHEADDQAFLDSISDF